MQEIVIPSLALLFNMKRLNPSPSLLLQAKTLLYIGVFVILMGCNKTADKAPIFFNALAPEKTGINFSNTLTPTADLNIIEYLYFYNGAGVAIGDLDNDGLEDIFVTGNQVSDKIYKNLGGLKFKDMSKVAGIATPNTWSNGVTMSDVNNDGLLDIYVCVVGDYKGLKGHNKLFLNKGGFTFKEHSKEVNLDFTGFGTQASFFDYDNDGDLDVYLLNHAIHTPRSYGKTEKRTEKDSLSGDILLENTLELGALNFVDVTEKAGIWSSPLGYGLGLATADLNKDGYIDIYVGNDFHENDYIYLNNKDKTFTESSATMLSHSSRFTMGLDAADLNNDTFIDLFTLDMMPDQPEVLLKSGGEDSDKVAQIKASFGYHSQYSRNNLQLNNTRGAFKEIALLTNTYATDWSWTALIEDFDNDGWSDIFISNGIYRRPNDLDYINYLSNVSFSPYNKTQQDVLEKKLIDEMPQLNIGNVILKNEGALKFSKYSASAGLNNTYSNGAAYSDLDLDGDLDLVVNNINSTLQVLENTTAANQKDFFGVVLLPSKTVPNVSGSKITLYAKGKTWYKELSATRGFASASSQKAHFGLGKNNPIDSLVISYLGGGTQTILAPKINEYMEVRAHKTPLAYTTREKKQKAQSAVMNFPFVHLENTYYDFEREPLMLEKLSTEGPCFVSEDFNGDGLKDLFIGGAKYQESMLYLQNSNKKFTVKSAGAINKDALYEDVDAAAIDFDHDGDLDLYVVSGGNDNPEGDVQLSDRLYINDGKANFTKYKGSLPQANGGSIAVADFNNDGYDDIFLGSRSIPGAYGVSPFSVVLKNTQKGNFELLTREDYGMITDSAWGDLNGDGFLDLVLVGDFMPVTVLLNKKGNGFENQTQQLGLEHTTGLWNVVQLKDLNADGKLDIIAGNAGLNLKLKASITQPVSLFLEDFDKNEQLDPIVFYYFEGAQIPFHSKNMLSAQMPMLKKRFTSYESFSKVRNIKDLIGPKPPNMETKTIKELRSMVYLNGNTFKGEPLPLAAQMSSIEDLYIRTLNGKNTLYYLGNYKGFVTALGVNTANPGGVLSNFNGKTFTKNTPLPLPAFAEGRAIGSINKDQLLLLFNNHQAFTLNLISQ